MKMIEVYTCPECGAEPRKIDGECDCNEELVIETRAVSALSLLW
jgi:predicted ATP-dependent serine protease